MMDELIRRCKKRDINAFEEFFYKYGEEVSRIIFRLTGDVEETKDLTQDVFLKVFVNLPSFKGQSSVKSWLYRIAVNTVWDYFRKKRYRRTIAIEGFRTPYRERIRRKVAQKELNTLILELLQEIPLKYKIVLILRDLEGYSYQEIAKVLKCKIGTVESRLYRARKYLLKLIRKQPYWRELCEM